MENYTVVIPAFNAAATIDEALESVFRQTVPPERVIVVDDGSTDATAEIVRRWRPQIHCLSQENQGPGAATTRGLAAVATPVAATLDADDIWLAGKSETQLRYLAHTPAAMAVFSRLRPFREPPEGSPVESAVDGWTRTTMMLRMSLFAAVGAIIDPPGRRGEMVDWLARAREAGQRLDLIDEVLAMRRVRKGSLSDGRDPAKDRGYLYAARSALQRRRNAPSSR
jgi:glycosyltransferase involved in cell wall biosynthesis